MELIQDVFIDILSFLSRYFKFKGTKTDFIRRLIIGNEKVFLYLEVVRNTSHIFFQRYHQGTFISLAMQNPRIFFFIFSLILKPEMLGGVSNEKSWGFFQTIE